jgi:hypothetical protein
MALTHELKDYVVYRDDRTGDVFQCHKGLWADWMEEKRNGYHSKQYLTMLVNNVTQNEARQFCQLARED